MEKRGRNEKSIMLLLGGIVMGKAGSAIETLVSPPSVEEMDGPISFK